jgi:selenocysteine lyase/cysteine desulfurase
MNSSTMAVSETTVESLAPNQLEAYFATFRPNIVGHDLSFTGPYGKVNLLYADWTASGRLFQPVEDRLTKEMGPYVGNTHTETTITGCSMTKAYHKARHIIKQHVGANAEDVLIATGSGMTGAINKFQRILGLRIHERYADQIQLPVNEQPVVFITHMEHHSNQTSWMETVAEVVIMPQTEDGLVDLAGFEEQITKYAERKVKIAAVTSCSNVTGIKTPYHKIAAIIHQQGGLCFVDFACSAPYIDINMRPDNPLEHLDALYFSPHKFLGGPGSSGILIFKANLYNNRVPDHPGGGTVKWTNPWGEHSYLNTIEDREDGGTPPFLQTIKVALAVKLKEEMGVSRMARREAQIMDYLWDRMLAIPGMHILAPRQKDRLPVLSFWMEGIHYNLAVKVLNDKYGIQVRGGCSCAGTYGHMLLSISHEQSRAITDEIEKGNFASKVGWIRLSLHPTTSNSEVDFILKALQEIADHKEEIAKDYVYIPSTNEFVHHKDEPIEDDLVDAWLSTPIQPCR